MVGCCAGHNYDKEDEQHEYSPRLSHELASSRLIEGSRLVVEAELDSSGLVSNLGVLVGGIHLDVCSLRPAGCRDLVGDDVSSGCSCPRT